MKTYLIASLTAFVLSAAFTRLLLPVLKKLKAGQNILCYVKEHAKKAGTPTMGGLAFISAAFICACLFVKEPDGKFIVALSLGLAYAAVGFLDDLLKIRRKDNLGLKAYQKIIFQGAAAILAGVFCYRAGLTFCRIPFTKNSVNFRAWMIPFAAFVFVALVNAVNLTDGLDGLASGASAAYFLSFGVMIALQSANSSENGAKNPLALLCFVLAAAICGFLLFNAFPASVFMGDTGSLFLGGAVCALTFGMDLPILLIPLGIIYWMEIGSVMLQVTYFKLTHGKRLFKMSPIHHHFELCGWNEVKICVVFSCITMIGGIASMLLVFFGV